MHSPSAFHAERIAWRAVIYLNLVRSIRRSALSRVHCLVRLLTISISSILDALAPESDALDDHDDGDFPETASVIISASGRPPSAILGTRVSNYDTYRRKLEPLVELEDRLIHLLSSPEEDEATHLGPTRTDWELYANLYKPNENIPPHSPSYSLNGRPAPPTLVIPHSRQTPPILSSRSSSSGSFAASKGKEIVVHTSRNWKKPFALGTKSKSPKSPLSGEIEGWWEDPNDPVHILNACAPAMLEMWRDVQVRMRLQEKRIRLEESSGLYVWSFLFPVHKFTPSPSYLDEIPRITAKKYIPTDGTYTLELFHALALRPIRKQRMY